MPQWITDLEKWAALHEPLIQLSGVVVAGLGVTVLGILSALLKPVRSAIARSWSRIPWGRKSHRFGIEITKPRTGQTVIRRNKIEVIEVEGTYKIQPGREVFAFVFHDGKWWPQPHRLSGDGTENKWRTKVHLGGDGDVMLYIVRADELGTVFIEYFRKVKEVSSGGSRGIEMTGLPEGLYEEAKVRIVVEPDSALKNQ
jgi:hypothetical protein